MNIYFFGDSISFGQGVSIDLGWVTKLSAKLRVEFPQQDITTINSSINGNTTRMALERMPYDIQSHDVDILVIGFGMNDCNYWETDKGVPRVSPLAFEANLKEIIDRGYNFGVKEIILRTNHPSIRQKIMPYTDITYSESNAKYNSIIRKVAAENQKIVFIDMEKVFEKHCETNNLTMKEFTLPDEIHLNQKGHEIYLQTFYPYIRENVEHLIKLNERTVQKDFFNI